MLLAVAWAVYLIPKALRHHDEVARTRSVDRFSTAMRVLAHREAVNGRDTRLVVTPARSTKRPQVRSPGRPATSEAPATQVVVEPAPTSARPNARVRARRTAARAAARRRRRILMFLLLCAVGTGAAAYLAYAPWWSVAIPGGLTLAYMLLCRTQVRHERVQAAEPPAHTGSTRQPAPAAEHVEVPVAEPVDEHGVADFDDGEDTIGIPVALLHAEAVSAADVETLWDPLPVTLPTYVTKPKARRTVRTIDLGEPGTWTSGRTEEDAEVVAQSAAAQTSPGAVAEAGGTASGKGEQRAVGS